MFLAPKKTPGVTSAEIAKIFHEIKNEILSISNLLDHLCVTQPFLRLYSCFIQKSNTKFHELSKYNKNEEDFS